MGGLALLSTSCSDSDDPVSTLRTPTVARFAPSMGSIPIPNDLLFSGSTDGTLNVPVVDPTVTSDPAIALGTIDGWSTTAPIIVNFTRPIDATTAIGGSSVFLFEVTTFSDMTTPVGGPVLTADLELVENMDYAIAVPAEAGGMSLVLQPLQPLAPSTATPGGNSVYMVVVTDDLTDTDGVSIQRDAEYLFASVPELGMEPAPPADLVLLNALVNSQLNAFETASGIARSKAVVSFTFTTQSIGTALGTTFGIANGQEGAIITNLCSLLGTCGADTAVSPFSTPSINQVNSPDSFLGTASELLGGAMGTGVAEIYAGILKAPYYLTGSMNASFAGTTNDDASLTEPWRSRYAAVDGDANRNLTRLNPLPFATSCQQVPMLISIPDDVQVPMPANGYPVVIFQHGITGNRASLLAIAEALAQVGLAAVAIDLPLHGVEFNSPLPNGVDIFSGYDNALPQTDDVWERTFGIDLLTEVPGMPSEAGPDGVVDSSGAHFINLANLAVTRDNVRQAVSDLVNLRAALGTMTVLGVDVTDETEVHFIGHSLGGIVGTPFVALQSDLRAATLGMAGSSLPYLLDGSDAFGPSIRAGLADNGIVAGSPEFSQFLAAAQTVVDSADPINYAGLIAQGTTPVYLAEIVGGGMNGSPSDTVVPNSVPGAPFAGTEPLISALGLTSVSTSTTDVMGLRAAVRFTEGNHGSLLLPNAAQAPSAEEIAAWMELQNQIAVFHDTDGQTVTVTNVTVVQ